MRLFVVSVETRKDNGFCAASSYLSQSWHHAHSMRPESVLNEDAACRFAVLGRQSGS